MNNSCFKYHHHHHHLHLLNIMWQVLWHILSWTSPKHIMFYTHTYTTSRGMERLKKVAPKSHSLDKPIFKIGSVWLQIIYFITKAKCQRVVANFNYISLWRVYKISCIGSKGLITSTFYEIRVWSFLFTFTFS